MAHFSERSPDGLHVLVVEMERSGWLPCRLVPFDGCSWKTRRSYARGMHGCEMVSRWPVDVLRGGVNGESHLGANSTRMARQNN